MCSSNEVKNGDVNKMLLRRELDVCALSKTNIKGKGDLMFGDVVCRVSGVGRARASEWHRAWVAAVCNGMEGDVIQSYAGVTNVLQLASLANQLLTTSHLPGEAY